MAKLRLPLAPMIPVADETVPTGPDWCYQLKWDGVRIVASIDAGNVQLYSRSGLIKNDTYPELVERLRQLTVNCVVDGEAVVFDPDVQRPVFQKVLQRERMQKNGSEAVRKYPVTYVLFDLLEWNAESWLDRPLSEREAQLRKLFPEREPGLFVTDTFADWEALWDWVLRHEWEGIVSKRRSGAYRFGKDHADWFKKKIKQTFKVDIVAVTYREGRVASLVMAHEGSFFGKISLGLNMSLRQRLDRLARGMTGQHVPFPALPGELKGDRIVWLDRPFPADVQGLEVTSAGLLRHPKILRLYLPAEV